MKDYAKENKPQVTEQMNKDLNFYKSIWKVREHFCENCGTYLNVFGIDIFHHILPKSKYKEFRHDERNIVMLCGKFSCHGKAESAISYPKMNIFEYCELRKKQLLFESGINYEMKTKNQTA